MRNRMILPIMALAGAMCAPALQASVVVDSLPYTGTPDWVDFQFDGSVTTNGSGESVLHTGYGGNWFGWGYYNQAMPNWSPSNNVIGNRLSLTTRLSDGGRDWAAYLADGAGYALMEFNPTYGCNGNQQACYLAPYQSGVSLWFGDANDPNGYSRTFVDLDLSVNHVLGFLLKGGLVSYQIDGNHYSGTSLHSGGQVLVIGDGSGSTQTGYGDMIVHAVSFDNAPTEDVSLAVPEPASWAMMLAGFGLVGGIMRSRRSMVAA